MTRWAMVADLERCVGCQTCTAACRHANATAPAVQWRKVLDIEAGSFPNVNRTFVPVGCQHCADPPCMHVCPSTATRQRADGIVTIDYDICIGCAYCDVACPYQARFKVTKEDFAYGDTAMQNEIEREDPARLGVAQKCTFCSDRIDFGIENGLAPGSDPRATPACVNACIADALHFGDLEDPDSNVSRLLRQNKNFRMHAELGTEPGFYYLYDKAAAAPAPDVPPPLSATQAGRIRTRGVEPWHQKHWDWKASGNFLCGGAGAGLLGFATIAALDGAPVLLPALVALAIIACGLGLLMFKIGRPLRFFYVLRQPQRSWMSREAWIAGLLFPLTLAALWSGQSVVLVAAAIAGLIFLFCQGMILEQAKGIPAWRTPRVIALIMATGLAEGCGLLLLLAAFVPALGAVAKPMAIALAALALIRVWTWWRYLAALESEGAPTRTLEIFSACRPWFFAGGLVLPVALVAAGLLLPAAGAALFALAGFSVLATGWAIKFILITRAAYNQGFALPHTPIRGTGVPGPAVKPGWTSP
ncbi:MAG: DmsC/YnfH family molybdoenzyme membrane anchor subunit [Pseudolabrys sp.]